MHLSTGHSGHTTLTRTTTAASLKLNCWTLQTNNQWRRSRRSGFEKINHDLQTQISRRLVNTVTSPLCLLSHSSRLERRRGQRSDDKSERAVWDRRLGLVFTPHCLVIAHVFITRLEHGEESAPMTSAVYSLLKILRRYTWMLLHLTKMSSDVNVNRC